MSSSVDEEMMDPDAYGFIEMKRADLNDPDHDWSRLSTGGETIILIRLDDGNRILIETQVTYAIISPDDEVLDLDHNQPWGPTYRKPMDPSYPEGMIEEVRGRLAAQEASPGDFADPADNPNKED